jgi:serine/threonine-protein kinase
MALAVGTRLGSYEITAHIGAGGMGEVYRARDTKLNRELALKLLPEAFIRDPERRARFEREARLLASLNHPNVATLYAFEEVEGAAQLLAMELVEGDTLAERIARGPLSIGEALVVFRQIAEGLEAAHQKGVIHRDLKPANVKITPQGKVKVLDFGLGKAFIDAAQTGSTVTGAPTSDVTASGVIVGTGSYMSPEQVRGARLDKRTDIWSFGCCFYEALCGRAAFRGKTFSDTLASVLGSEPDWKALPAAVPRRIREVLARCLTKDPEIRLHDIADARIELAQPLSEPPDTSRQRGIRDVLLVAIAAVATALTLWSVMRAREPAVRPVIRSVLPLPAGERLSLTFGGASLAISPDGRHVAYLTRSGLMVLALDHLEATKIEGPDEPRTPFFSPDNAWIGFTTNREIMRAAITGGAPVQISPVEGAPRGVDWSTIGFVLTQDSSSGLFRSPAGGGLPEPLTKLDDGRREKSHRFPQVLPGGESVLFSIATSRTETWDDGLIAVGSIATGQYKIVLEGGSHARYSRSGHLVYARGGNLLAVPFDLERLAVTGQPVRVLSSVMTSPQGSANFALSENGTLVYAPGLSRTEDRRVVWVDRQGRVEPIIDTPRPFSATSLSPDGHYLALQVLSGLTTIVIHDIERKTITRWTSEWDNAAPVWHPNGREIAFSSARGSNWNLYKRPVDGSEEAERLGTGAFVQVPTSWSPDGKTLAFQEDSSDRGTDIFALPLQGDRKPQPLVAGRANESRAMFSPDGRWIAYQSDETGREEIYVCRFPGCGEKRPVSNEGGAFPVWNPDGQELFYRSGDRMVAVAVKTEEALVLGSPTVLFTRRYPRTLQPWFDVSRDGKRFIDLDDSVAEPAPTHLVLVQNFDEELTRLVRTK